MHRLVWLLLLAPAFVFAAPDRAGLIKAWEAAMNRDGALAAQPDGSYRYHNEAIGYDGAVSIVSAIVRSEGTEELGQPGMTAMGTVDFDLVDMPARPKDSMASGLMMWKAERQSFIYDDKQQTWQTAVAWAKSHYDSADDMGRSRAPLRWLMDYAIPIGLVALLLAVFAWLSRAQRQSRLTMKDASEVNRFARENVERAARLQDEQKTRMEESISLARRNTALLESILEELRKRP